MSGRTLPHPEAIPHDARESGVLLLLQEVSAGESNAPEPGHNLIFIERTEDRSVHSRQIAFPGGRREIGDASLMETALREAEEEIGIDPDGVKIVGALTPLYIPVSNFMVYPFVGIAGGNAPLTPQPSEVARIIPVPVSYLFSAGTRIQTIVAPESAKGETFEVPAYQLPAGGPLVWGATAMILSEFEILYTNMPSQD